MSDMVTYEGKNIVIKIPFNAIENGIINSPSYELQNILYDEDFISKFKITDITKFGKEIVRYLMEEDEVGDNLLYQALDQAAVNAIENGCDGIEFLDE